MVGQILGTPGNLPDVYRQIEIKTHLLPRLLGVAQEERKDKEGTTRKKGTVFFLNYFLKFQFSTIHLRSTFFRSIIKSQGSTSHRIHSKFWKQK